MTLGALPRSPLFKARKRALPKVGVLKHKLYQFHEEPASDIDLLRVQGAKRLRENRAPTAVLAFRA